MRKTALLLIVVLLACTSCARKEMAIPATLILRNAKIWTGDDRQPSAQAVAVIGDEIVRIGKERCRTTYAFRSLLDSGARVAFGSDWPVAPLSPVLGIYAAVTRSTLDGKNPGGWIPEQKISVAEAVRAYTSTSAYAEFAENGKGTISPGKLADFVVLSADIFNIPPEQTEKAEVVCTVVGGRIVYEQGR
jgi:hypothetical protein